jgi:glycosyltransferase involved in cell wall biosynthesis
MHVQRASLNDNGRVSGTARRVLYLMPNAHAGGAERGTMTMVASHDRARYEPSVLFFNDGPLVDEAKGLGVGVHVLPRPFRLRNPASIAATVRTVRTLLADEGFALVHSCMSYAHLVGGVAASLADVPAVLYQHGPVGTWLDGAAAAVRCDRILANSAYTAAEQDARGWRSRPTTIAPYGIDLSLSPSEQPGLAAQVDALHALQASAPLIGIIARFDPWKGIDIALMAAAPLLRARRDLRFVVVGGQFRHFHPEYGATLRALVDREAITEQVIFAGYQSDVRPYLARMSVLIHAARQPEPFGLTIIEAMASGVPVVAARGGGVTEIIDPGKDGLLYKPGDEAELRGALTTLLDDTPLRHSFRSAGLAKVEARYRPATMMRTIEAAYDELLLRP